MCPIVSSNLPACYKPNIAPFCQSGSHNRFAALMIAVLSQTVVPLDPMARITTVCEEENPLVFLPAHMLCNPLHLAHKAVGHTFPLDSLFMPSRIVLLGGSGIRQRPKPHASLLLRPYRKQCFCFLCRALTDARAFDPFHDLALWFRAISEQLLQRLLRCPELRV